MRKHKRKSLLLVPVLILIGSVFSARAQEVSIPDPGLDAAIREALLKPNGPLTEQDLLSLTVLDASRRNVSSVEGLQAARNLTALHLQINQLASFSLPGEFTNLVTLDLSANLLTNCFIPGGLTNLAKLALEGNALRTFSLPASLTGLNSLDLEINQLSSFNLPSTLTRLVDLNLGFNLFTNFTLPGGLTNLSTFYFAGNPLTNVVLPPGLIGMTELNLSQNQLTRFTLPTGMTNLSELNLAFNQLTNLTLPADLQNLNELNLDFNQFTRLDLPTNLNHLQQLHLRANQFTNVLLPEGMITLRSLDLRENQLSDLTLPADLVQLTALGLSSNKFTSFTLPAGLTNLVTLNLSLNPLTNLVLPPDLIRLETLNLSGNPLTSIRLPSGLTHLTALFVTGDLLTELTLPPDMTALVDLGFLGNPLTTLVLSEVQATNLADTVIEIESQGTSVFVYPLTTRLVRPRLLTGAFQIGITGPPGAYAVFASSDLADWSQVGMVSNTLGSISFVDATAHLFSRRFYRAMRQDPPVNMVFVPPNTFTMGSPTNELHRQANEGPQTIVTLTRGFWIGKHEVTQGEFLDVTGTNPSFFPGDLNRPVETVSWPDATNYCGLLTQRELAAGRIPTGSHYRLPTEAEWECAARAGTTTRFSYGDDPDYTSLTNHAWYFGNSDLMVHPVGQKLPNPWGLYDLEGNVWEWTLDWLGDLPGGTVIDPTGPPSNPIGLKVVRGGSYDFDSTDCRSARRFFFGNHPALHDSDLGFRVVLDMRLK